MITISESAAKKLASLKMEEGQIDEAFLRVEVKKAVALVCHTK